jgi:hypothetical protein
MVTKLRSGTPYSPASKYFPGFVPVRPRDTSRDYAAMGEGERTVHLRAVLRGYERSELVDLLVEQVALWGIPEGLEDRVIDSWAREHDAINGPPVLLLDPEGALDEADSGGWTHWPTLLHKDGEALACEGQAFYACRVADRDEWIAVNRDLGEWGDLEW